MRILITFLFLFSLPSYARWATLEDSPAVIDYDRYETRVKADGTSSTIRESLVEIRNEEGRTGYGTTTLKYNSRASKIELIQVETRNRGTSFPVEKKFIEDKPLASSAEGFDETRQVNIAFPNVDVSSKLFFRYKEETTEVPFANFYSTEIQFGSDLYEKSAEVKILSAMPLLTEVNDPGNRLTVKQGKEGEWHRTVITLKKPVYTRAVDEDDPFLSQLAKTWVVLSSHKTYPELARIVASQYEQIISAELPKNFVKIAEAAKKKKTSVEKMDTVTSMLADEIRYLGDWRPTRGGHIPRPLALIASTKFGDCKDFSVATAAILRRLGFETNVAWVERALRPTRLPKIPLADAFNHAIVYVKDSTREYWVDPTNLGSFAAGTFEDIAGRPALVVSEKNSRLLDIPIGAAADSKRTAQFKLTFEKERDAVIEASLHYTGRRAATFAGLSREYSKDTLNHLIAKAVASNNYVKWTKFEPYDLFSRIAKELTFSLRVGVKNLTMKTSAGKGLLLDRGLMARIIDLEEHTRVSDLYMSYPQTDHTTYHLLKTEEIGTVPINCKVDSKWIQATRTVSREKQMVVMADTTELKLPSIANSEMKTKEFQKLQEDLQSCFHQVALIFK